MADEIGSGITYDMVVILQGRPSSLSEFDTATVNLRTDDIMVELRLREFSNQTNYCMVKGVNVMKTNIVRVI